MSQLLPHDLCRDNIRLIVEAVRQTYKAVETVPKDYGVKILLLQEKAGYLEHCESYDGSNWDCYKNDCDSHRDEYFNLSRPNCSTAVASCSTGTIQIVECCEECHKDDGHPFRFFHDCIAHQREELGSMLVIPFATDEHRRFVLCLTCSQPSAFLKRHIWKAKTVQENLQARIGLLYNQADVFDALRTEVNDFRTIKEELESKVEDLDRQISNMQSQVLELQDAVRLRDDTIVAQNTKVEELDCQISSTQAKISDLKDEVQLRDDTIEALNSKLKRAQETETQLTAELEQLKKTLADVKPRHRRIRSGGETETK